MSAVMKLACFLIFIFVSPHLTGCGNSPNKSAGQNSKEEKVLPPKAVSSIQESFQPFYIFSDTGSRLNHYVPSGFMPDGKCVALDDTWSKECVAGSTCLRINYDIACSRQQKKWAGIYWLNPANNWGQKKEGGFTLTGAQKLTFWAKGEKGGERIEEFKIGGITGEFPDTDTAVIGPVILTSEWKEYSIDLRGKDLSYISGGFAWSTNVDVNPESCTFYLDDMRYE